MTCIVTWNLPLRAFCAATISMHRHMDLHSLLVAECRYFSKQLFAERTWVSRKQGNPCWRSTHSSMKIPKPETHLRWRTNSVSNHWPDNTVHSLFATLGSSNMGKICAKGKRSAEQFYRKCSSKSNSPVRIRPRYFVWVRSGTRIELNTVKVSPDQSRWDPWTNRAHAWYIPTLYKSSASVHPTTRDIYIRLLWTSPLWCTFMEGIATARQASTNAWQIKKNGKITLPKCYVMRSVMSAV